MRMRARALSFVTAAAALCACPATFAANPVFSPSRSSTVFKGINRSIVANTSIDVSQLGSVSSLAISGTVSLAKEKSFVRVVLVTATGEEYLVLETNPLLAEGKHVSLDEYCEETKQLDGVKPALLRIETKDASLNLTTVSVSTSSAARAKAAVTSSKHADREAQHAAKLLAVRFSIKQKGLHWAAGDTPVSRMTYAQKKQFFGGKVPSLAGLEYYVGGIFEVPSSGASATATGAAAASAYVSDFSWRTKHGQNWLTPVRNQGGCGSCWAFGATGATELLTNIYFNRHLDLDLSEQEALSCMSGGSCAGGSPGPVLDYITQTGIYNEGCFPYTATDQVCSNGCSSPTELIRIGGRTTFFNDSEDTLKSMLLTSAVSAGVSDWWHVLTLAGYRTLKVGDSFFVRDLSGTTQWITVTASDTGLIGRTVWEFKNSWGPTWGDGGYVYVLTDLNNIYLTDKLLPPVTRQGHTDAEIACVDTDGDGYYAWGIGPKPAQCPAQSQTQPDGDDSEPCKGPMDQYGKMSDLCATVTSNFIASNLAPCMGTAVTFTDLSTGPVTSWTWNFGAGASPATATGKGPFNVTYSSAGAKTVSLTVAAANGTNDVETKAGYITVPSICTPVNLEVYARNEAYNEPNQMRPRIYVANMGSTALSDFKVVFKFTTNGKTPILEDYYTPNETATLTAVSGNTYKVVYDFTGYTLNAGAVTPDTAGNVVGLHYSDWSPWTVTSTFTPGYSFALNTNLGVYDKYGTLVYGTAQ